MVPTAQVPVISTFDYTKFCTNRWISDSRLMLQIPGICGLYRHSLLMPRFRKSAKAGGSEHGDYFRSLISKSSTNVRGWTGVQHLMIVQKRNIPLEFERASGPNLCSCLFLPSQEPGKGTSNMGQNDRRRPRNDQGPMAVGVFKSLHSDGPYSPDAGAHPWGH